MIGHRGSFGHFPEHSIAGYTDAYLIGVDFVELDLQLTKDGHLVTNHDPCLKDSTNIEDFADLWGSRMQESCDFRPEGNLYSNDWLLHDFSLAELKMLRRRQRYDYRSQYNNAFSVMTLEEVIEHMYMLDLDYPRKINEKVQAGLYIEIK